MSLSKNTSQFSSFLRLFVYLSLTSFFCLFSQPFAAARQLPSKMLRKCWDHSVLVKNGNIASDNSKTIFLLTDENKIESIDAASGQINWTQEVGGSQFSNLMATNNVLYIASKEFSAIDDNKLQARIFLRSFSIASGIPLRAAEIDVDSVKTVKLAKIPSKENGLIFGVNFGEDKGEGIYIARNEKGFFIVTSKGILLTDEKNNSIIWQTTLDSSSLHPINSSEHVSVSAASPQNLFFYGSDTETYVVSLRTGDFVIYRHAGSQNLVGAAAFDHGNLFVGDNKGVVSLIKFVENGRSQVVWTARLGGGISSLSVSEKGVLVTSLDNFVYLLNQGNGSKIWKKRLSGRLLYKPLLSEKEKQFIVTENNTAYFVDLTNGAIINQLTLPPDQYFINSPFMINDRYLFQTKNGIAAFSFSAC